MSLPKHPIVMTMDDTAAAAALAMWSRGLKSLPVIATGSGRLVGFFRAETVMQVVLRRVARPAGFPEVATAPVRSSLTSVQA